MRVLLALLGITVVIFLVLIVGRGIKQTSRIKAEYEPPKATSMKILLRHITHPKESSQDVRKRYLASSS